MPGKFPRQYEILLKKADADLALVQYVLTLEDKPIDIDIVFFHLQQAVEKYLKALICYNGVHFEKIHDIDKIITVCRNNSIDLPEYIEVFIELNPYAVEGRYAVISDDMDDAEGYAKLLAQLRVFVAEIIDSEH
ncbi:MAG: HEPN domain-containing protein [Desulfuromonadales bacterium]